MYRTRTQSGPIVVATAAGLVAAATAAYADEPADRDCAPRAVHTDIEDEPLTQAERIARLDAALFESLARFDDCQSVTPSAAGQDARVKTGGGDVTSPQDGASGLSGGSERVGDAETPQTADSSPAGASVESVAAHGVQGTEAPEDTTKAVSGTEEVSASGSGEVPDDIPAPDNDSVLEAQIRRAAMEETDPRLRAELWNEYRKYKGLPPKSLPEDDGERSDAQSSE